MILPSSEGDFILTEDMLQSLRTKYQHVDVDRELAKINLWLYRNPSRRWSRMLLGIEKWLGRVEAEQRKRGAKLHVVTVKQKEEWWATEESTLAHAEKVGKPARPGESFADLRRRLRGA